MARVVHDLALCLILGGIAGTALCAGVLFERAPSREIAGHLGSVIFGRLGPAVLVLALVVVGTRLMLSRDGSVRGRRLSLVLAAAMTAVAMVVSIWLTPQMITIWNEAPHAPDGSGLLGEDRARFFMLHGMTNLGYIAIGLLAACLVGQRAWSGERKMEEVARPHRGE